MIDVKRIDAKTRFATTDGSRNDIDPFFRKCDYIKEILQLSEDRPVEPLQIVAGCTCLEYDRLFSLINHPRLEVGDRVLYHNVGAYTMTLSPQFIRLWPRVYSVDANNRIYKVRQKTVGLNIIQLDSFESLQ